MSVNKTKITQSIMAKTGWTPVPNEIWETPLSAKSKIVYIYLLAQAPTWEPSIEGIADGTRYGRDSVMSAIRELEKANMLFKTSRGPGLRNEYVLTGLEEWDFSNLATTVET